MGVVGIAIFNQTNRAVFGPTGSVNTGMFPLLDLTPLIIAAIVVIGGIASLFFILQRGM
jgi:hypothetical protein